jgi:hypothetical protein
MKKMLLINGIQERIEMHNEAEELRRELEWLYTEYNKVLKANNGLEKEVAQLTQDNYELNRLLDDIEINNWGGIDD